MQLDQQVAIDLNCSNADDGTVSLSIGAAVACRRIAKLNFLFFFIGPVNPTENVIAPS
jgi:hypothetical protein